MSGADYVLHSFRILKTFIVDHHDLMALHKFNAWLAGGPLGWLLYLLT